MSLKRNIRLEFELVDQMLEVRRLRSCSIDVEDHVETSTTRHADRAHGQINTVQIRQCPVIDETNRLVQCAVAAPGHSELLGVGCVVDDDDTLSCT